LASQFFLKILHEINQGLTLSGEGLSILALKLVVSRKLAVEPAKNISNMKFFRHNKHLVVQRAKG